jgi:hypothetical protein
MKRAKIFVLAAALASSTANAAVLQDVQGEVRVGRDKGFAQVQGSTELLPGDRVKVGRKGSARIVYPDGCSVPVGANSYSRVGAHSPCSFKAVVGDPLAGNPEALCDPILGCPEGGVPPWVFAGLGVGVFGGIGVALATTTGPSSPPPPFIPPSASP